MSVHGRITALVAAAAMTAASNVAAAPFGGARIATVRVEAISPTGYRVLAPVVFEAAEGARIHGVLCRTSMTSIVSPGSIRIEQLDSAGEIVSVAFAELSRGLSGRDSGCAFYDRQTHWRLDPSSRVRVSTAGARQSQPG